tara:strand:- start:310 stop:432 length:123 start_codon:yes stop_codon:yes gene_type:complete
MYQTKEFESMLTECEAFGKTLERDFQFIPTMTFRGFYEVK